MGNIARLLLGPDGDRLFDLLAPESGERRMTARVREAGEWCQSTPTAGPLPVQHRARPGRPTAETRRGRC